MLTFGVRTEIPCYKVTASSKYLLVKLLQTEAVVSAGQENCVRPKGNYGVLVSMINQTDGHSWPGLIKPHCSEAIELACSAVE